MKATLMFALWCFILSAGCSARPGPTSAQQPSPRTTAGNQPHELSKVQTAPWDPLLLEGGFMFKDFTAFRQYVEAAQIIATGTLKAWDGRQGEVHVDTVYRGKAEGQVLEAIYTGGLVRPKAGQKVIVMLSHRGGVLKLHSFCAASGLYDYTEQLASVITEAIESAG